MTESLPRKPDVDGPAFSCGDELFFDGGFLTPAFFVALAILRPCPAAVAGTTNVPSAPKTLVFPSDNHDDGENSTFAGTRLLCDCNGRRKKDPCVTLELLPLLLVRYSVIRSISNLI